MYQSSLRPILEEINGTSGDILASSVLTRDGLALTTIASAALGTSFDEDQFAAQVSASMHIARKVLTEPITGQPDSIFIAGDKGHVWMAHAGPDVILALLLARETEMQSILPQAGKAVREIETLVSEKCKASRGVEEETRLLLTEPARS